jgi:hypothetical protein
MFAMSGLAPIAAVMLQRRIEDPKVSTSQPHLTPENRVGEPLTVSRCAKLGLLERSTRADLTRDTHAPQSETGRDFNDNEA